MKKTLTGCAILLALALPITSHAESAAKAAYMLEYRQAVREAKTEYVRAQAKERKAKKIFEAAKRARDARLELWNNKPSNQ